MDALDDGYGDMMKLMQRNCMNISLMSARPKDPQGIAAEYRAKLNTTPLEMPSAR
jgi:hypothetical protein